MAAQRLIIATLPRADTSDSNAGCGQVHRPGEQITDETRRVVLQDHVAVEATGEQHHHPRVGWLLAQQQRQHADQMLIRQRLTGDQQTSQLASDLLVQRASRQAVGDRLDRSPLFLRAASRIELRDELAVVSGIGLHGRHAEEEQQCRELVHQR